MNRRRYPLVAACGLVTLLAVPSMAQAAWQDLGWISPHTNDPDRDASYPQVAIDYQNDAAYANDGNAVAVWEIADGYPTSTDYCCERVQARARAADGTLGPIKAISPTGELASNPQVDLQPDGDAIVVWKAAELPYPYTEYIKARRLSATGQLGAIKTISALTAPHVHDPQVAVDSQGDAIFVWWQNAGNMGEVKARTYSNAGTLGSVLDVSGSGEANHADVAIDADGDATVVWGGQPSNATRVRTRTVRANGILGITRGLTAAGSTAYNPLVDVDDQGDAVFSCGEYSPSTNKHSYKTRALSAAGTLSATQTLATYSVNLNDPADLSVDSDGDAIFAWPTAISGTPPKIVSRMRSNTGTLSAFSTLSGQSATYPEIATDQDGDSVAIWVKDGYKLQGRTISSAGVLGSIQQIFTSPSGGIWSPDLAVNSAGSAIAGWAWVDLSSNYPGQLKINAAVGP